MIVIVIVTVIFGLFCPSSKRSVSNKVFHTCMRHVTNEYVMQRHGLDHFDYGTYESNLCLSLVFHQLSPTTPNSHHSVEFAPKKNKLFLFFEVIFQKFHPVEPFTSNFLRTRPSPPGLLSAIRHFHRKLSTELILLCCRPILNPFSNLF